MNMYHQNQKKRMFFIAVFLINSLFASTILSFEKDLNTMNTPLIEKISEFIPSDNSFFYQFDDKAHLEMSRKLITTNNSEGMILGTPDIINIDSHNEIPLLWIQCFFTLRRWKVEKKRNSFLIIVDLERDLYYIKSAYSCQPKRFNFSQIPKSSQGNPPPNIEGFMAGIDMLDIREVICSQLKPTKYAITMTQYDWISNTVQINLIDSTVNTPQIPLISQTASRQIYNEYNAAAKQMKDFAMFSPSLKPPAITQNGIAAVVPQKVAIKDYRWMMHGSVRVSVAPGAMVNKTDSKGDSSELPAAIVSAMVIVNKLDNKEPSWITLQLPVLTPCKVGDIVNTSFSVDLKQYNGEFKDPGLYQVFVACGAFVAGPFALEVTE